MCTNLLRLNLNKDGYKHILGCRDSIVVPCGKCPECLDQKVSALYQRNYLEYEHCLKSGGYAYFDTLTYNDNCLPCVNGKQYFKREDLTSTIKRLRSNLKYIGYNDKVRFFFIVEYGETFDRIHGHIIFYVYDKSLHPLTLHKLLCRAWRFGFCDSVFATMEHVLTSSAAIKYIMKYVTKNFEYKRLDDDELHRMYRPFYRCSINLGFYPDENDYSGKLRIATKEGFTYQHPCFYFLRKIGVEKDTDLSGNIIRTENGSYMYHTSIVGLQYRCLHLEENIDFRLSQFVKKYQLLGRNKQVEVDRLLEFRDLRELAIYDLVYRGVAYQPELTGRLSFCDYQKDFYDILTWQNHNILHVKTILSDNDFQLVERYNYICANNCSLFFGFDKILQIFSSVSEPINLEKQFKDIEQLHSINRLKDMLK